ncbi:MAG: L-2-amino-thiazoline-4-carboxylic acid hydrolase [Syntrophorhabdaceae bacterium]
MPVRTGNAAPGPGNGYYIAQKAVLMKNYQDTLKGAGQLLLPEMGFNRAEKITRDALANFEKLIPDMPDAGGSLNPIASLIPVAGWYIALYGPMREMGKKAEDAGKILYELSRRQFDAVPYNKRKEMEKVYFSPKYIEQMSGFASWTQKRQFPGNWVTTFVKGDGTFDYGVDYTECALEKYCRREGVPEMTPYICLGDFLDSKTYGSGLARTKTLATREGVCNFRYKKGRPVVQDWGTEIDKIRQIFKGSRGNSGAK